MAYLDSIFGHLTDNEDATGYGNDELALELDDIFCASGDMIECGELTVEEKSAVEPLDSLLGKWSGEEHIDFWSRTALFSDPRWQEVRQVAAAVLAQLPDEQRAIGRSA